jgi:SAM-dependent methyltransferase
MASKKLVNCPICNSNKAINMLDLNCGNLDNSTLYPSVKINACTECGHVYNRLSPDDIEGLIKYYNEEYAPLNLGSTDKIGDRPGSDNPLTLKRHTQLYSLISSQVNSNSKVLDVGCAMGGFLDYLHKKGLNKLCGIDLIEDYVSYAKKKGDYIIKLGSAESIPFEDNSFDLLVLDQVMEHLVEPVKAFREAKRVLVEGGLFCIGIPDALRYDELYFFDFYWFIMREHIQHFDVEHLKLLAKMEGFELVSFNKCETPILNEKMILPNLNVIFRLSNKMGRLNITENCFKLKKEIEQYIVNEFEKLNIKRKLIDDLVESQKPLYVWGIGREFLYLYESAGLKNCNIVGLIDTNFYKQKTFSVDGKKIMDKSILEKATSDSILIITAIAHTAQIEKTLQGIDYSGEVLEFE